MRIEKVSIKNFRAIKNCTIEFDAYTSLIGSNGVGKSTVLAALNVFFGNEAGSSTSVKTLSDEDFFQKQTDVPVEIKVTFTNLSDDAKKDFKHYVRVDQLIVAARATFEGGTANVERFASRMGIADFAGFFELNKAADKKEFYKSLQVTYTDFPNWTNATVAAETLRSYEQNHPQNLVEMESRDKFYGVSKGTDILEKHIQWVYVPAVKDAVTEEVESKNTAFTALLDRAVRSKVNFGDQINDLRLKTQEKYQELIEAKNDILVDLSASLKERLQDWGSPRATLSISWYQDPAKLKIEEPTARLKTGELGFEGSIGRIGHGLQRSYLIALLHELATHGDNNISTLVLGIEEPELYQHPPQAKYLAQVLQNLSDKNAQVIVATHSPYFVSGRGIENVRVIRRNDSAQAYACSTNLENLAKREAEITGKPQQPPDGLKARLDLILQPALREMLFTDKLVLVEGIEDQVILATWIHLGDMESEFRRQGISIVPVNGKSQFLRFCLLAEDLKIPTFLVFDGDNNCKEGDRQSHASTNNCLFRWSGDGELKDFVSKDFVGNRMAVWKNDIQSSVFGGICTEELDSAKAVVQKRLGGVTKLGKNSLFLYELMFIADELGWKLPSLDAVVNKICDDSS